LVTGLARASRDRAPQVQHKYNSSIAGEACRRAAPGLKDGANVSPSGARQKPRPGIDDVLQGGIEADAYCSGGARSSYYSAWIEWFPNYETRVSSPAISPGDLLFVEVWNVSATQGYVYFHDFSTNVTAEYGLTAPSGTTLRGNSVEWIVERPGVGGGLATLTNYIDAPLTQGIAWDYSASPQTYYYPNVNPAYPATLYLITMLDNLGHGISSATGWNAETLWFLDFGSACGLGNSAGNPC
jgi:hypothetical protein